MCWLVTPFHTPCSHTSNPRIYTPCKELAKTVPIVGKAGPFTHHIRPHYPPKLDAGCKFNKLLGQQDINELCGVCLKTEQYQKELRQKEVLEPPEKGGMTWRTENGVRPWSEIAEMRVDFGNPKERRALREEMLELAENNVANPPVYGSRPEINADVVALRQKWNVQSSSGEDPVWKSSREESGKDRAEAKARKEPERPLEENDQQRSVYHPSSLHQITEESKETMLCQWRSLLTHFCAQSRLQHAPSPETESSGVEEIENCRPKRSNKRPTLTQVPSRAFRSRIPAPAPRAGGKERVR